MKLLWNWSQEADVSKPTQKPGLTGQHRIPAAAALEVERPREQSSTTCEPTVLSPTDIRKQVQRLDTTSLTEQDEVWSQLRPVGGEVVPYLAEAYPRFRTWQGRAALVYYAMPYSRIAEHAFLLGVAALNDRPSAVRHWACGLLAYAQRRDALPQLEEASERGDQKLTEDATAAIAAIKRQNHHLFKDRTNSGRVSWVVNEED